MLSWSTVNLWLINIRVISSMISYLLLNFIARSSNHLGLGLVFIILINLLIVILDLIQLILLILTSNKNDITWIIASIIWTAMRSLLVWSSETCSAPWIWALTKIKNRGAIWLLLTCSCCYISCISLLSTKIIWC